MRALIDAKIEAQNKPIFKLPDISKVVFNTQCPILTVYPFRFAHLRLVERYSIDMQLRTLDHTDARGTVLDVLSQIVVKINHKSTTSDALNSLYPWMLMPILKEYYTQLDHWHEYFFTELDTFCDSSESLMNWEVIKSSGVTAVFTEIPLKFEQRSWISNNAIRDRNKLYKYADSVRESLLPWLNIKMYDEYVNKKENTRVNVAYENTRLKLLSQADKLQQSKPQIGPAAPVNTDLDIIE